MVQVHHATLKQHRGGVEDVVGAIDTTEHDDDVAGGARDLVEHFEVVADEGWLEQQVFGRVAGQGELWEGDELGAGFRRAADLVDDFVAVTGQIADGRVDLG